MKKYLSKDIFSIETSAIITAPTGAGKTIALLEYIKENNLACVIVSPLNELGNQISEKNDMIKAINSETTEFIHSSILSALINNKSIIISLKTFCKYVDMFYNIPVFIDECHKLIEYNDLCDTEKVINAIKNNRFKRIIGITATPLGLDFLLKIPIIKTDVNSWYKRKISLETLENCSLENILGAVYDLYQEHGKLVVMYNNKLECMRLTEELKLLGLKVLNYNSDVKEVRIVDERFSEDFDILFCTSSLTTGVSIIDQYHAVCILRFFDTINAIPQFFARNRNEYSTGTILRTTYFDYGENFQKEYYVNQFASRTDANKRVSDSIKEALLKLKTYISKIFLELWLEKEGNYEFYYNLKKHNPIELKSETKYKELIDDQRDYFINNITPKFNSTKYKYLRLMYALYNFSQNEENINDPVLEKYLEEYIYFTTEDGGITERIMFYDYFYPIIKDYYKDKAKDIASKVSSESLDVADFEKVFLDKKYSKKELKSYCINKFSMKEQIFKNKESINIFLENIGCKISHKTDGYYIVKLE